jgi:MinD-like ATPase involved in chromosome partitioning or flagellar assembly
MNMNDYQKYEMGEMIDRFQQNLKKVYAEVVVNAKSIIKELREGKEPLDVSLTKEAKTVLLKIEDQWEKDPEAAREVLRAIGFPMNCRAIVELMIRLQDQK